MRRIEEMNYYNEFIKNAELVYEEAKVLRDYISHFNASQSEEIKEKVHDIENEADKSQHNILNYLVKDFVPPIDREDIIKLCHEIDNVADSIDEVVININIYKIRTLMDDVGKYIDLLNEMTECMVHLMQEFKGTKKRDQLSELIVKINNLEEDGDSLFQNSIKRLYDSPTDPIEVIKWTTIYNCFENCYDAMEHVSDVVDEVIMKNS